MKFTMTHMHDFLDAYPLLNTQIGLEVSGNEMIFQELLELMLHEILPEDEMAIQKACEYGNWQALNELSHRIKGGAMYCGAIKMQYACEYIESVDPRVNGLRLKALYAQLINVMHETKAVIAHWLENSCRGAA